MATEEIASLRRGMEIIFPVTIFAVTANGFCTGYVTNKSRMQNFY